MCRVRTAITKLRYGKHLVTRVQMNLYKRNSKFEFLFHINLDPTCLIKNWNYNWRRVCLFNILCDSRTESLIYDVSLARVNTYVLNFKDTLCLAWAPGPTQTSVHLLARLTRSFGNLEESPCWRWEKGMSYVVKRSLSKCGPKTYLR